MNRYDWGWGGFYDRGYGARPMRGYGSEFARDPAWWGGPEGSWAWGGGYGRAWSGPRPGSRPPRGYDRYDRGVYGGGYPGYRGYPGDVGRGPYQGGRVYDSGYRRPPPDARPVAESWGYARGYDRGMTAEPFLPEPAYERHPELDHASRHPADGDWPGDDREGMDDELDDDQIQGLVRQSLSNDAWIDAERIQVEVSDQVVTLTGEVDDYLEARYAWDDAWEAIGVRGVINRLTVRTEPAPERKGEGSAKPTGRKR